MMCKSPQNEGTKYERNWCTFIIMEVQPFIALEMMIIIQHLQAIDMILTINLDTSWNRKIAILINSIQFKLQYFHPTSRLEKIIKMIKLLRVTLTKWKGMNMINYSQWDKQEAQVNGKHSQKSDPLLLWMVRVMLNNFHVIFKLNKSLSLIGLNPILVINNPKSSRAKPQI